jgi:tRNA(fMet)-specific endonuclease VapC
MANYLLDTNHASRLMSLDEKLLSQIRHIQATPNHSQFGVSVTVLGELYFAVYASQNRTHNLYRLTQMLNSLVVYEFDATAAELFGRIQAEQKAKGRPIPPMDAQIASVAQRYHLTVLTADKHFSYIDNLLVENWL